MLKPYKPPVREKESFGEKVVENAIFFVVACVILYFIIEAFKAVFKPLWVAFLSPEQKLELDYKEAEKKIQKRELREVQLREDLDDPLTNGLEKDTPWFKDWSKGLILDPEMMYAPKVYDEDRKFTIEFLNYLSNQVDMHLERDWIDKVRFESTIKKYYPEFTSDLGQMIIEIEDLKERVQSRNLQQEFVKELERLGLSDTLAEKLLKLDISAKEIKRYVEVIKSADRLGYTEDTGLYCATNNLNPGDLIVKALNDYLVRGLLPEALDAYRAGHLNQEDMEALVETYESYVQLWGYADLYAINPETGETFHQLFMEGQVDKLLQKKKTGPKTVDERLKAVWEKF